ncbi:MAG: 3-isopropylmalate dehydratase small subunit, partial [Pyramidobacter sp.]|nr:3-isopropylmalate dehydratase small subunit [Pyramidobacter sp.]
MDKLVRGHVFVFGKNIDTDQIYPGIYVEATEMDEIKRHAMAGSAIPDLVDRFQPGDIIVADTNFGCGSSREHAVMTLKGIGIGAILAGSYGRIFYRNAINLGVPALE